MSERSVLKWNDGDEFGFAINAMQWTYEVRDDGTVDLLLGVSSTLMKRCSCLAEAKVLAQILHDLLYGDSFSDIISRRDAFAALDTAWEEFMGEPSASFDWVAILEAVPSAGSSVKESVTQ